MELFGSGSRSVQQAINIEGRDEGEAAQKRAPVAEGIPHDEPPFRGVEVHEKVPLECRRCGRLVDAAAERRAGHSDSDRYGPTPSGSRTAAEIAEMNILTRTCSLAALSCAAARLKVKRQGDGPCKGQLHVC